MLEVEDDWQGLRSEKLPHKKSERVSKKKRKGLKGVTGCGYPTRGIWIPEDTLWKATHKMGHCGIAVKKPKEAWQERQPPAALWA